MILYPKHAIHSRFSRWTDRSTVSGALPPILVMFPPIVQSGCIFAVHSPHSAKESPFPVIRKAGQGRTLSGQTTSFLHFFPSEGALLSIQPYIMTLCQLKHTKITTHASYQNLGGYMAKHADSDTRDGCTRRCSGGYISRLLPHFSRHDPAFLLPERNAVCPDFLHAIPTQHRRIVPLLDLLHRHVTGGV